jgi:DivIVA domain-containing protein
VGVVVIVLIGMAILAGVGLALSMTDRGLSEEPSDHRDLGLPDRPLTADDVTRLRFRTGARGYRMQDVDAALERIADTMRGDDVPPPADQPADQPGA